MAVDVSNLVNMLATQPGQNISQMGGMFLGAQEAVRQREAQAFKQDVERRKIDLEEKVANQKLQLGELEMMGKRGEILSGLSQSMLTTQDPMVKRQLLSAQAPLLKKAGVTDEQLAGAMQNIDNPEFWRTVQAQGVANTEYWKSFNEKRENKAPTTRSIRQGEEIVNQEWRPDIGPKGSWVEVGRGPIGKGFNPTINIGKENALWATVFDRYEKAMKPIVEQRAEVERIKTAINTPGGASAQALQSSIANLFGGQTRAVAELERWANFGNLPERVINSATKFLTGEYSEESKADALRLLRNWEYQYLNKEQEDINKRFTGVAEKANVPQEFFMRETPEVRMIDFSKMGIEDIKNIDLNTLELDERKALERRLTELGY